VRPSRKYGVVALGLLQALQLFDTGTPHLYLGLEGYARLRGQEALMLVPH
jgi:hypothetical protein